MERARPHLPPRPKTRLEASLSRRMSHRHDALKVWEGQAARITGTTDTTVHETPEALESHTEGSQWALEAELGHRVLAGEIDCSEAYELLGP